MQKIILKVKYFEKGLSKSLKKVTSFFLSNPVSFNRQNYQKQKGPGTCGKLLFRLQNKLKAYVIGLHNLISMNVFFIMKDHTFFFKIKEKSQSQINCSQMGLKNNAIYGVKKYFKIF